MHYIEIVLKFDTIINRFRVDIATPILLKTLSGLDFFLQKNTTHKLLSLRSLTV